MRGAGDALADEMRQIEHEVAFGVGWSDALARSADRTGIPELRSLGSLMAQTERFGSELSRTLDVMAESIRHEETQSLEERAHRASVRMLFPLAALMLPATLLLIVAPLLLLLFEGLLKATA
jgi:tight adherence protein C